ncbi:uncharacterized protein OGAPODRAFT_90270, partial [Ogataea polymorpha]|uniref:uncharacterized protein n=1 Tax=Ogataea polymorpha TaxID=460523 RepID=UPI0007F4D38A
MPKYPRSFEMCTFSQENSWDLMSTCEVSTGPLSSKLLRKTALSSWISTWSKFIPVLIG